MSADDKVGYKRPPKKTQWKKGHSGNPRGRPKHARNLKTELTEELGEMIPIREQGSSKRVSKLRAVLKMQMANAVKGDARAASIILNVVIRVLDLEPTGEEGAAFKEEDIEIIQAFLKRRQSSGGAE